MIPSLGDADTGKLHVVHRKSPNPGLSFSINGDIVGAALGEVSIGDSDIRQCNERVLVEHEISLAKKVWSFAKENLGVKGLSN